MIAYLAIIGNHILTSPLFELCGQLQCITLAILPHLLMSTSAGTCTCTMYICEHGVHGVCKLELDSLKSS